MGMGGKGGPSGTTQSTQTAEPWGPQQPYIKDIFSGAQSLYQGAAPVYFPGQTYAPQTGAQNAGLQGLIDMSSFDPLQFIPSQSLANISGGNYLNANPAFGQLTQASQNNYGEILGNQTQAPFAQSNYGETARGAVDPFAQSNYGEGVNQNYISPFSSSNYGEVIAPQTIGPFAWNNAYWGAPGNGALGGYASGERLAAGNPWEQALTDSVSAKALPGIQSQFIGSGMMSSPEAMRASAAGLTSAIAPFQFQNYQNEEANQMAAANALGSRYMQGTGMQQQAAQSMLDAMMQGRGMQQQAGLQGASTLMQGRGMQQQAGQDIGNMLMSGRQQQQQAANDWTNTAMQGSAMQQQAMGTLGNQWQSGIESMLRAAGLAPSVQAGQYSPFETMFNAGTAQQGISQQSIDDAIARWNFGQELPYNRLNEYIGQVTGNYGGTTQLTQPYFNNSNSLGSTLGGVGSLIGGLSGASGASSGLGFLLGML